jgi:hypothetical protein
LILVREPNVEPTDIEAHHLVEVVRQPVVPSNVIVPWDTTFGVAWRFGPTAWNDKIAGDYPDERQLTVAIELTLMGCG